MKAVQEIWWFQEDYNYIKHKEHIHDSSNLKVIWIFHTAWLDLLRMSRKPEINDFSQQRLAGFSPKLSIVGFILEFFVIGMIFIPLGCMLLNESRSTTDFTVTYDAPSAMDVDCSISVTNQGGSCQVLLTYRNTHQIDVVWWMTQFLLFLLQGKISLHKKRVWTAVRLLRDIQLLSERQAISEID